MTLRGRGMAGRGAPLPGRGDEGRGRGEERGRGATGESRRQRGRQRGRAHSGVLVGWVRPDNRHRGRRGSRPAPPVRPAPGSARTGAAPERHPPTVTGTHGDTSDTARYHRSPMPQLSGRMPHRDDHRHPRHRALPGHATAEWRTEIRIVQVARDGPAGRQARNPAACSGGVTRESRQFHAAVMADLSRCNRYARSSRQGEAS